jgi:hypothetical protein
MRFAAVAVFIGLATAASLNCKPGNIQVASDVEISWSDVENPAGDDFIGVYSPPDAEKWYPLTRIYANETYTYQKGYGSWTFSLLNMRQPYEIRYYPGADDSERAASCTITVDPTQPSQVHLALTGNPAEMRVMWTSGSSAKPTVRYGLSASNLDMTATGAYKTYTYDQLANCWNDSWATEHWYEPGNLNDVLLSGLQLQTQYFYQVGSSDAWSDVYNFTSSKPISADTPVHMVLFGDLGTGICQNMSGWCEPNSEGTTDRIAVELAAGGQPFDMVLHFGDISYAVGHAVRWEQFFDQLSPLSTQLPWMVSIGNHEYDYPTQPFLPSWSDYNGDSHGECGIAYSARFTMPTKGSNPWWSINYGNIHFMLLSFEHNFTQGSEQFEWMVADFAAINRSVTPFVVVGAHRPLYCSGLSPPDNVMGQHLQAELEDTFVKYAVDLFVAGHYHLYERTCSVYKGECVDWNGPIKAPVHALIGNAGQYLNTGWMPQPSWSLFRDLEHYGFGILDANRTHLHLRYIANLVEDPMDEVYLTARF